jgi:hypothetical protein
MAQKSVWGYALVNKLTKGRFPLNAENSATSSAPRRRPHFYGVTYSISYFACVGNLDDLTILLLDATTLTTVGTVTRPTNVTVRVVWRLLERAGCSGINPRMFVIHLTV